MAALADERNALAARAAEAPPLCGGVRIETAAGQFTVAGELVTVGVYPHASGQPATGATWYIQADAPGGEVYESRRSLADAMRDAVSLAARDGKWPAALYVPAAD